MRTLTRKARLKMFFGFMLIMSMLLSTLGNFASADANNPKTDFMSGKYGIFQHYRYNYNGLGGGLSNWNSQINSFNVNTWANNVAAEGVSWVMFTVGQGQGYYVSPNSKYDSVLTSWGLPARSPNRDLINELADAMHARGIKFFAYFVGDANGDQHMDPDGRKAMLQSNTLADANGNWVLNQTFRDNTIGIVQEWANRWGTKIDGWFIDGIGEWPDADKTRYINTLKAPNPNTVVTLNAGSFGIQSTKQDYVAGEIFTTIVGAPVPTSRWGTGGMQWHGCYYLGGGWGGGGVDNPDSTIIDYTRSVLTKGGAFTWDQFVGTTGNFDQGQYNQMINMKNALAGITPPSNSTNLALNAIATASANVSGETPAMAVDNSTTTKWTDNTTPGDKWLKLDLGSSKSINRWAVKHASAGTDSADRNTRDFKLQKSSDGNTWTDVDTVTGNTASVTDRNVADFSSRYIRLYITKATQTTESVARIFEIELYGNGSGSGIVSGNTYKIVNRNSGKALGVQGQSTADGAAIQQFTYGGGNYQKWIFTQAAGGYWKIKNVNSGKYMDINGASTADGAANIQWPDTGGDNQLWQLIDAGNGYYKIKNKNSGKLLDISGQSTADGAADIQWPDNGGNNQMWQIIAP
ncbi:hypothetical protein D7Z26_13905 [Cohnella endophytica]|uniref:F5/8 type C domain-containing protein n=1 Tax=Cohnella endophytica TaxID=2419778 RepID=A0A494XZH4_9BACL|nr:RICIN domain-containing protein [Cohnella endophytica]RKP54439.1 hypothetical protein D7Z26_13905 [Cohnella endophytica]